jgi:hypothetical protein
MSTDPIGFEGEDANLYRYVGNAVTGVVDYAGQIQRVVATTPETTPTGFKASYTFELDNQYDFGVTLIQKIDIDFRSWQRQKFRGSVWVSPVSIQYFEVVGHVAKETRVAQTKNATSLDTWNAIFSPQLLANYCFLDGEVTMTGQVRAFRTKEIEGEIAGWQANLPFAGTGFAADRFRFPWTSGGFPAKEKFYRWSKSIEREFLPVSGNPPVVNKDEPAMNRIQAEWSRTGGWKIVGEPGQLPVGKNSTFLR